MGSGGFCFGRVLFSRFSFHQENHLQGQEAHLPPESLSAMTDNKGVHGPSVPGGVVVVFLGCGTSVGTRDHPKSLPQKMACV